MMQMQMQVTQSLSQRQAMMLTGGVTQSVFPAVETWLQEDTDRQKALKWVGNGRLPSRYHSVIDAVFCLTFPAFEKACQTFYKREDAPLLIEMVSPVELDIYELALIRVLETAYELMCAKRRASWGQARAAASCPLVDQLRALGPAPTIV